MTNEPEAPAPTQTKGLARRVGLFDATMVVIGGIVGAGIFRNPHVVAMGVHQPAAILGVWLFGGLIALAGALVYAEISAVRAAVGGQYTQLKEAFHPALAFIYGWGLLLVIQTGGMAAVSVTFSDYFLKLLDLAGASGPAGALRQVGEFTGLGASRLVAAAVLLGLTVVNSLGVRAGATVQSLLTVLKMGAIAGLVGAGLLFAKVAASPAAPAAHDGLLSLGAAMVPVLFAYGGWQTACFIGGEVKRPERNLPLALVFGVLGVVALYLAVNWVCLRVLGPAGLAATNTPAADVAEAALGHNGSLLISAGIVVSTLGFLSQGMLTAPRVYFAMADDGLFFKALSRIHPDTQVPVAAIATQGFLATLIAFTGRYEQILNYVVSVDFTFNGLTALCVFVYRRKAVRDGTPATGFKTPLHPWTTLFFTLSCWLVVANSIHDQPLNSLVGIGIMLTGLPVFLLWSRPKANS
jgi:basic amino acid/polyamine antiporter, APA family